MRIKINKKDSDRKYILCEDIEVTDDQGNVLNEEILSISIGIFPNDIVRATCVFSVAELDGIEFIENIDKKYAKNKD